MQDLGLKCDLSCHSLSEVQITTMADSRDRARKTVASRDEGSLDGSSDSEAETDQSTASRNKDFSEHFKRLAVSNCEDKQETAYGSTGAKLELDTNQSRVLEQKYDQWLKEHPWENQIPKREERMERRLVMSQVYTLPDKWLKGKNVDLEIIYLSLSKFVDEMKGPSIRQELEEVLQIANCKSIQK